MRMRHIVICGLPRCIIFYPHYLINGTVFWKNVIDYEMCVLIFSRAFVWNILHSTKSWTRYDKKCTLLKEFIYSYCCLCMCILIVRPCIIIVVYVFLLFVHVFLSLSMYTYCCPCILRRGYPDWGFCAFSSVVRQMPGYS